MAGDDRTTMATARVAGALWLLTIGGGLYAEVGVRGGLIVPGNALATATAIAAHTDKFRLGLAADLLADLAYLGLTMLLFRLFRTGDRAANLLMVGFGAAGSAILAANLTNLAAPLMLLDGAANVASVAPMVRAMLRLHGLGYSVSMTFFAVQVGALGWMILRTRLVPRLLGVLFLIEAAANLVEPFGGFLRISWIDAISSVILLPGLCAEGGMALWLLIMGIRRPATPIA